jgi:small neutral amino acid transporter SnatA (MarC family)
VGGEILTLLMAIAMLPTRSNRALSAPEEAREAAVKDEPGVISLGIPLAHRPGERPRGRESKESGETYGQSRMMSIVGTLQVLVYVEILAGNVVPES